MKRTVPFLFSFLLLLSSVSPLRAQELETGYFLGGNPYAFRLNPAFQSERNIVSIGLGQTGLGAWSNLGASTLLYPDANGYLYTFLNDRVDEQAFLRKISRKNILSADARVNLLTIGFWSKSSFMTLDFNVRSLNSGSVPYDLFDFLKGGTGNRSSFDFPEQASVPRVSPKRPSDGPGPTTTSSTWASGSRRSWASPRLRRS